MLEENKSLEINFFFELKKKLNRFKDLLCCGEQSFR